MNDPDDATVHYTVKELFENSQRDHHEAFLAIQKGQAEGFARIEVAMSGKADKADVARMEARLDAHGKALDEHRGFISALQIQAREEDRARKAAVETNAWWHSRFAKIGGFLVGVALIAAAVVPIIQALAG